MNHTLKQLSYKKHQTNIMHQFVLGWRNKIGIENNIS